MNLEGELGYKGERGYSAYEIAVQHGYIGTEEQWSEDFLNAENYYDKSEIDAMKADYVLNGNFAVITGTQEQDAMNINIDYPTGFNKDNCIIIGCMVKYKNSTSFVGYSAFLNKDTDTYLNGVVYNLTPNKIAITNNYAYMNDLFPMDYRIVLMKIGE